MSAEPTLDVYQRFNQPSDSQNERSAADIVVDNLGEVVGRVEAEAVYNARAKGRPMLLINPQKESRARLQRKSIVSRQKDDMSRRKRNQQSGKGRMPKTAVQGLEYSTFLGMHTLWAGYMSELLNLPALSSIAGPLDAHVSSHAIGMQTKLVKADFHGCKIAVKASKCPTLVGCSGIVIEETANVFRIITPEDRIKVLPKQNSIFTFGIPLVPGQPDSDPQIQFELYGNQFRFRSDDRASRKFKHKETIEL